MYTATLILFIIKDICYGVDIRRPPRPADGTSRSEAERELERPAQLRPFRPQRPAAEDRARAYTTTADPGGR